MKSTEDYQMIRKSIMKEISMYSLIRDVYPYTTLLLLGSKSLKQKEEGAGPTEKFCLLSLLLSFYPKLWNYATPDLFQSSSPFTVRFVQVN